MRNRDETRRLIRRGEVKATARQRRDVSRPDRDPAAVRAIRSGSKLVLVRPWALGDIVL